MTFQTATKILTAEDIRHMYETPVEILPAQGENIVSILNNIFFQPLNPITPFTNGGEIYACYSQESGKEFNPFASSRLPHQFLIDQDMIYNLYVIPSLSGFIGGGVSCEKKDAHLYLNAPLALTNLDQPFEEEGFEILITAIYYPLTLQID